MKKFIFVLFFATANLTHASPASDEGWGPEDLHNLTFWANEVQVPSVFCRGEITASLAQDEQGQPGILLKMQAGHLAESQYSSYRIQRFVTMYEARLQVENEKMYLSFSSLKKQVGVARQSVFNSTGWSITPTAHIRITRRMVYNNGRRLCEVAPLMVVKM